MKTYHNKYPLYLLIFILIYGCTNDFDEINTNPNQSEPISIDPELQLTYVLNRASSERFDQWRGNLIYCSNWCQQLSGDWDPDRYNTTNEEWISAWWINTYLRLGKDLNDLVENTEETNNIKYIASIFRVFVFQRLTDMYGDIPYSEANQGSLVQKPAYDRQEDLYNTFIRQLREAVDGLSTSNDSPGSADIIYNGDIEKWTKFANSLQLRLAMRMSNVNPSLAQEVGRQAIESGIINSFDDIAYVGYSGSRVDGTNASGISEVFLDFGPELHQFSYSDEMVNFILNNNDPRETILMETYTSDGSVDNSVGQGFHLGRPNGIPAGTDDFVFAQPNRETMVSYSSPIIYFSQAESEFLLAEAILKGWVSGEAQTAYENGIRAAMRQLDLYPNVTPIASDDVEDYLTEIDIAYDSGDAVEQINTQKWVALIFDGFEGFANLRRSGYPDLSPGLTDGESGGEIPRRLRYPLDERINNGQNYDDAVSRLPEGDEITSRMWWDVN